MASTYEPIATQTLGSSASSVTFSSISGSYTDLVLVTSAIGTGDLQINGRVNSDTGSNYSSTYLAGNGTSAVSDRQSNGNVFGTDYYFSVTTAGNASILQFMNYSNSTTYKTILARSGVASKGTMATVSLWRNTAAITSITLLASQNAFNTSSTFTLYGIKAA
jgi:hypothetical protein